MEHGGDSPLHGVRAVSVPGAGLGRRAVPAGARRRTPNRSLRPLGPCREGFRVD